MELLVVLEILELCDRSRDLDLWFGLGQIGPMFCDNCGKGLSLLQNTGVTCFDLTRTSMKEVSSKVDEAFQSLITRRMVSGSAWSRTLSTTNIGSRFRSVLGFGSLTDKTDMCTFNKLGSTSKVVVPAIYVTSVAVCTGFID